MTADSTSDRRALRWTLAGLGVFVIVVGGILAWARFGPNSRYPFDEAVARAEAAGLAVRVRELPGWDMPPEEDGMALLDRVRTDVERRGNPWTAELTGPWDYGLESPWYEHASSERMEALRAWLAENDQVFVDLDLALARRAIRARDEGTFSWTRDLRTVGHLLEASMYADPDAGRRLRAASGLVRLGDRTFPHALVASNIGAAHALSGLAAIQRELEAATTPATTLSTTLSACGVRERSTAWRAAIRAEVAWLAEYAKPVEPTSFPKLKQLQSKIPELQAIPLETPGITWAMIAKEFDYNVRLVDLPASDFRTEQRAMLDVAGQVWTEPNALPAFHLSAHRRLADHDAALRLLHIALAATVRRERDGRWPTSLAELAPDFGGAVPVDPTSNRPFSYETSGDTMRVEVPAESPLRKHAHADAVVPTTELIEAGLVISVTR